MTRNIRPPKEGKARTFRVSVPIAEGLLGLGMPVPKVEQHLQ